MGLDSVNIRSFNDLGEAFVKQYKYNIAMLSIFENHEVHVNTIEFPLLISLNLEI